jgi:ABC-type dipeptide/oligopeptide/nickel transport system ATPase subunit
VRDMVKHFNTAKGVFRAVDGVDVDIPPSSICALLGPSGSGEGQLTDDSLGRAGGGLGGTVPPVPPGGAAAAC